MRPRSPDPMPGPGGQACETCCYFLITDYPTGYCREESPAGETARIKIGKPRPWPLCYAGDWCGQYLTVADYLAGGGDNSNGGQVATPVTFPPVVSFGGSSAGIVLSPESIGRYQQIGGFIDFWVQLGIVDKGSQATGELHVSGLPPGSVKPFTPVNGLAVPNTWGAGVEPDRVRTIIEDNGDLTFAVMLDPPILMTDQHLNAGGGLVIAGTYPWVAPPAAR